MLKIRQIIFISAFFIISILPAALMGVYDGAISENRAISLFPSFFRDDGSFNTAFFDATGTYISEHFAFRDKLLLADSYFKHRFLNSPSDPQVILGKEGWMYFDLALPDHMGPTISPEELQAVCDRMVQARDYISSLGKEPVFLIVPNKATVYPEYMPDRFTLDNEPGNLECIRPLMVQAGLPFVDALEVLAEGKDKDEMYLHYDTHWNNTGARMVMNALYEKLGVDFRYETKGYSIEPAHDPDLYTVLYPGSGFLEDQHIYEDISEFEYSGRFRTIDDMDIRTFNPTGNGEGILMYRDSFGRAMIPCMAQVFSEGHFLRATPYDLSEVAMDNSKYVVIEIVERNLPMLGDMIIPGS